MRNVLRNLLCEPGNNTSFELEVFRAIESNGEQDVIDGILYRKDNGQAYPIISGVPIMIKASFPDSFCRKYSEKISKLKTTVPLQISGTSVNDWSFFFDQSRRLRPEATLVWKIANPDHRPTRIDKEHTK